MKQSKIIFAHPAIRQYRQGLFRLLDENLDIRFLFTEDYEDNLKFLSSFFFKKLESIEIQRLSFLLQGSFLGSS